MSPLGRDPPNLVGHVMRIAMRSAASSSLPTVMDARYDHIVILGVAIGLIVGATLVAKLIASDVHHEPY
jgi:hypothetical protein